MAELLSRLARAGQAALVIEASEFSRTRITARCAMEQNRDIFAVPGNVTNKNAWGPNTLIKQGAKLTATWEDIWEDLSSVIRLQLEDELGVIASNESKSQGSASLFSENGNGKPIPDHQGLVFERLRHDEAVLLDNLIESLEANLTSVEIFTALFELELAGKVRQLRERITSGAFDRWRGIGIRVAMRWEVLDE